MNKILTFIINEENKFLILYGSDKDPQFHRSFWYVVTGGCEEYDETRNDTVKREIFEETNLKTYDIMYLNWVFKYTSLGTNCVEYVYFSKVRKEKIILNEENIDYKWCDLDTFIDLIEWFDNKIILKQVLTDALNNKLYFKNEKIKNVKAFE